MLRTVLPVFLVLLFGCSKEPTSDVSVRMEESDIEGASIVNGALAFDSKVEFYAFIEDMSNFTDPSILETLPFETYEEAYLAYIRELDEAETLPERFDEDLVHELPEEADTWFDKIVQVGFLSRMVNRDRELIVGDTLWRVNSASIDFFSLDKDFAVRSSHPDRQIAIHITDREQDHVIARAGSEETVAFIDGGDCERRRRLYSKVKEINSLAFCSIELRVKNERGRDRLFGGCKWSTSTADYLHLGGSGQQVVYTLNNADVIHDRSVSRVNYHETADKTREMINYGPGRILRIRWGTVVSTFGESFEGSFVQFGDHDGGSAGHVQHF